MSSSVSKRVIKNFAVVLRGKGIAAILTLAATALMAHALPVVQFGLVILLHTYILAIRGFLNFRTYEAIVKYGVPLHEASDNKGLKSLLRTTTLVDVTSGMAATLVGISAASVAGYFLHWDEDMVSLARLYSLVMLSTIFNTPNGVLRIYDRFDALSVTYTIGPMLRLAGVILAWLNDAGMSAYVAVWAIAFVLENTWLFVRGHIELKQQTGSSLWGSSDWKTAYKTTPDLRHFIGVVYWQTNLDLLPKHLAVLLAGSLLGPAAAGMFRLARDFSSILSKPAMLLREVLFPDLTRILINDPAGFNSLGLKAMKAAGAAGFALAMISVPTAGPILGMIGDDYTAAATLLTLMLIAATFELAASPLRAAAYALGKVSKTLRNYLLGVLVYFGFFVLLTPWLGLNAPGIAACLGMAVTLKLMWNLVRPAIRPAL
jgi:O-antigen/teichoic acid export membrane protein